jgi:IPT/TIG domain-containing protein
MRSTSFVVALVVWVSIGLASIGTAQTVPDPTIHPTIHNVTLHEGSGVLTITGTGFGRAPLVTVDGQPATVLQGATDTRVDVVAPAVLLTTPGSYRLTVVDPVRQVGDAFVVASQGGSAVLGGTVPSGPNVAANGTTSASVGSAVNGSMGTFAPRSLTGPAPMFIEDSGAPYRTALGYQALLNNNAGAGFYNTASGYQALYWNGIGSSNTASGYQALFSNTNGGSNTASGYQALFLNTVGTQNTASGVWALTFNTTGYYNTASGYRALYSNTTGYDNTANGHSALYYNTTARYNTAFGWSALFSNTTGNSNTALGNRAGLDATTGSYNLFLGADVAGTASDTNTIRIGLPYSSGAGQNRTFIAGIYGTAVSAGVPLPVVIDANGQLGTMDVPLWWTPIPSGQVATRQLEDAIDRLAAVTEVNNVQQQQLQDQQTVIADLRARLARLEALVMSANRR